MIVSPAPRAILRALPRLACLGAALAGAGCGGSASGKTGTGATPGMMMPGTPGTGGMGMMGKGMMGMDTSPTGAAGAGTTCSGSTAQRAIVVDCGYPYSSSNPLTSIVFNESDVLQAIEPSGTAFAGVVRMFYNDEHAMTLGVREVVVKSGSGSVTSDYPVSALTADPGSVTNPQTGSNVLAGDQSGIDQSLRPMWPALFITDVSTDPTSRTGDWQQGGRPIGPNAVYGTWKAAVRTVDNTVSPSTVTITPDADPAKNNWTLGSADTVPSGLGNEGYGTEVVWNVPFTSGHSYRVQVLVHDGDQNKVGGDAGEACVLFCANGGSDCGQTESCGGYSGTGGSGGGSPGCPAGISACASGGPDGARCASGLICANGCCVPNIPIS